MKCFRVMRGCVSDDDLEFSWGFAKPSAQLLSLQTLCELSLNVNVVGVVWLNPEEVVSPLPAAR